MFTRLTARDDPFSRLRFWLSPPVYENVSDWNRPPRKPSYGVVLEKWGLVEAWLAADPGRMVVMSSSPKGLRITLIDPLKGEQIEDVETSEDPSAAAVRCLGRFPLNS